MKEAKKDFDSIIVGNSLSNRAGDMHEIFSPFALLGAEVIVDAFNIKYPPSPPPYRPIKVRKGTRPLRVNVGEGANMSPRKYGILSLIFFFCKWLYKG